jgi:hypothetical protein
MSTIVDIVRRLDGLPLAIELATARLHTLEVAEVAAGLDDRFDLLSTGYRTASRHGSLAAAMSWSVDQLDPRLQLVFADLSAFAVAFTAADAAAVCGVDLNAARADLDQLVERSLVMRAPPRRFVLLETLRAFGAEQRVASGRADVAAERHARHQVAWIEAADRRLLEPGADALPEIDAAIPELRSALGWLLDHHQVELAGRLVSAVLDYGLMRLRPDVLAWAERVTAADPNDVSPVAPVVWAVSAYAAWMAGDVGERVARGRRALRAAERSGRLPGEVAMVCANASLFEGRLDDAVAWYRRGVDAAADDPAQHLMARTTQLLALGYRGDPDTAAAAAELLEEIGDARTPYTAYVWYCAGEADMAVDLERAGIRLGHAVELAEQTHASFVIGLAGASKTSIEARFGDPEAAAAEYRRLIAHWRRAGMWSTQWTMLRAIAGLLARLERHRDAAVLLGAVRATQAGHRIFGADDAALVELAARLRGELGDDAYEEALDEGAGLDGDDAVEHALRAL